VAESLQVMLDYYQRSGEIDEMENLPTLGGTLRRSLQELSTAPNKSAEELDGVLSDLFQPDDGTDDEHFEKDFQNFKVKGAPPHSILSALAIILIHLRDARGFFLFFFWISAVRECALIFQ
jgi:hypothetical protein